jgi:hypothetical protein
MALTHALMALTKLIRCSYGAHMALIKLIRPMELIRYSNGTPVLSETHMLKDIGASIKE